MADIAVCQFLGGADGTAVTTTTEPFFTSKAGTVTYATIGDGRMGMRPLTSGTGQMYRNTVGGLTKFGVRWKVKMVGSGATTAYYHGFNARDSAVNAADVGLRNSGSSRYVASRIDNAASTMGEALGDLMANGEIWSHEAIVDGNQWSVKVWDSDINFDAALPAATYSWGPVTLTTGPQPDNFWFGTAANTGVSAIYFDIRLTDGASVTAPTPVLKYNIVGAPTSTGFTVAARTTDVATGARIKVSTTSDLLTSPVYSSSTMPDANGYVKMTITGLNPNTLYYWGTELDGVLNTSMQGKAWTLPTPGTQSSFVFASSSCHDWTASPAFDNMRSRLDSLNAKFFLMLGDLGYAYVTAGGTPIAPSNQAQLRLDREIYLEATDPMEFYRNIAFHYTYSDCDGAGANSDGTWPAFVSGDVQAAYRQQIPNPTLPLTDSQARSFVVGRVRIIQTDELTMSSARGATDDASKSKLGTAQKAWFKAEIDAAKIANQVVVWAGDGPWVGGPSVGGTLQEWRAYNTERVELGDYIATSGVKIIRIHGDTHALAADTGVNNAYGGFPFISAAPFSTTAQVWGLPVSNGFYPASAGAGRQYGEYTITDNGYNLQLAFSGRAWDGVSAYVEQVQMTIQWDMRSSLNTYRVTSLKSPTMQYARPR